VCCHWPNQCSYTNKFHKKNTHPYIPASSFFELSVQLDLLRQTLECILHESKHNNYTKSTLMTIPKKLNIIIDLPRVNVNVSHEQFELLLLWWTLWLPAISPRCYIQLCHPGALVLLRSSSVRWLNLTILSTIIRRGPCQLLSFLHDVTNWVKVVDNCLSNMLFLSAAAFTRNDKVKI